MPKLKLKLELMCIIIECGNYSIYMTTMMIYRNSWLIYIKRLGRFDSRLSSLKSREQKVNNLLNQIEIKWMQWYFNISCFHCVYVPIFVTFECWIDITCSPSIQICVPTKLLNIHFIPNNILISNFYFYHLIFDLSPRKSPNAWHAKSIWYVPNTIWPPILSMFNVITS